MDIKYAFKTDLAEILRLQYEAFKSEADLYQMDIPPMQQTLASLQQEYERMTFLIAVEDDEIIGSVRAYEQEGVCHIGKLIVSPKRQNQGIGRQLMLEIERVFSHIPRLQLFTGHRSEKNIALYTKLGYIKFAEEQIKEDLFHIHMYKVNT